MPRFVRRACGRVTAGRWESAKRLQRSHAQIAAQLWDPFMGRRVSQRFRFACANRPKQFF